MDAPCTEHVEGEGQKRALTSSDLTNKIDCSIGNAKKRRSFLRIFWELHYLGTSGTGSLGGLLCLNAAHNVPQHVEKLRLKAGRARLLQKRHGGLFSCLPRHVRSIWRRESATI